MATAPDERNESGKIPPANTEAYYEYYEEQASQEELYLEQVEENVRLILTTETKTNRLADNPDEWLDAAVKDLLTGDSDDPPLSEQTIEETLEPGSKGWNR